MKKSMAGRVDPGRLTPTDAAALLGVHYEALLRYVRELEDKGLLEVHRESSKIFLSSGDLPLLAKHHQERAQAAKFRVAGDVDLHKRLLGDLKLTARTLQAMARRVRVLVKELAKGPASSTSWISTLPATSGLTLRKPIAVTVDSDGTVFNAYSVDTGSTASGSNRVQAVRILRDRLAREYLYLLELIDRNQVQAERLADLKMFIRDDENRESR